MKVVLASHSPNITWGAERSLLGIAQYLVQRGASVAVALPGDGSLKSALDSLGISNQILDFGWAARQTRGDDIERSLAGLGSIVDWVAAIDPDVVLTNTSVIPWFAYAAELLGKPHVWRVSEVMTADVDIDYSPDLGTTYRFIAAHADIVFATSAFLRDLIQRELGRADVRVVYPSVDRAILDHTRTSPGTGDFRIVHAAGLTDIKNQLELLRAARSLRERRTDFIVTFIGAPASPEYARALSDFVRDNDMSSYITFTGAITDPYPVIAEHDICAITARHEASGRVIAEAMLLRTVVVASDLPSSREKAGEGEARFYPVGDPHALADALDELMSDRGASWAMAQRAYERAFEFYFAGDPLAELWSGLQEVGRRTRDNRRDWIDGALLARSATLATIANELTQARIENERLTSAVDMGAARVTSLEHQVDELTELIATTETQRDSARHEAISVRTALDTERALIRTYAGSTSWRLTHPLREAARGVRKLTGAK